MYLIHDLETAINSDLLRKMIPGAASRLDTWPPPRTLNNTGEAVLNIGFHGADQYMS